MAQPGPNSGRVESILLPLITIYMNSVVYVNSTSQRLVNSVMNSTNG